MTTKNQNEIEKEISLSEKRFSDDFNSIAYHEKDVKEFIKRQLCPICQKYPENNCSKTSCNKIKKDAGDKLC